MRTGILYKWHLFYTYSFLKNIATGPSNSQYVLVTFTTGSDLPDTFKIALIFVRLYIVPQYLCTFVLF